MRFQVPTTKTGLLFISPYQSPYEQRSASQKRTLTFYSATILAYFGNPAAYRVHLKKLCKSAAFFALFRSPAIPLPESSPSENRMCRTVCPPARIVPPKTGLFFISTYQRPYEEEIGRPNAAKYDLTFSDEKHRFLGRIIPSFWAIIPLWYLVRGNPGPIRARMGGA